jgi:REP element-mobilizing transposase RayT
MELGYEGAGDGEDVVPTGPAEVAGFVEAVVTDGVAVTHQEDLHPCSPSASLARNARSPPGRALTPFFFVARTQRAGSPPDNASTMARRRRYLPPGQDLIHVSFKCVGDAFLMRPDAYTSFVIACALEEAATKYGVRIHAFCFLSTHAHLLLGVRGCRLDLFMQLLKSRIARTLNVHRERDGAFFKGRYRDEAILSVEAAVGIEQYVHQQSVHHGLVERAIEWPGLCSYGAIVEGRSSVEAHWFDEASWREAGARREERGEFTRTASVPLSVLPHRAEMSERELRAQRQALAQRMKDVERDVALERRARGAKRLPEPSKHTTEDPNRLARRTPDEEKSPQPWAHGTDDEVQAFRDAYDRVMEAYELASARYRETGALCPFPAGTFPPRIPVPMEVMEVR